jgi:hypothetical protein
MTGYILLILGMALVIISPLVKGFELLTQGLEYMADVEAQALADLSTAVSNVSDAITAGVAALTSALANNSPPIDHSPAIEGAVASLNTAAAALKNAIPPVVVAAAAPAA